MPAEKEKDNGVNGDILDDEEFLKFAECFVYKPKRYSGTLKIEDIPPGLTPDEAVYE